MALHLNELKRTKVVFRSSFLSNHVFERGSEKRRARVEEYPDFWWEIIPIFGLQVIKEEEGR